MAKTLKRHPFQRAWRRDLFITGLISLLLATAVLLYTFGLTPDFMLRVFNATIGFFILIAGTAFLVVPSVNWLFGKFSKKKAKNVPVISKRNLPRTRARES